LEALGRPPIGYLDPELFELLDEVRAGLRGLYGTSNEFTVPLTGTGMAGMQSCLANLLEPGDRVLVGVIGYFGERIVEICRRLGAEVTVVKAEWGTVLDPDVVRQAAKSIADLKLIACVHSETSTGVLQPLEELVPIAREYGALFLADAVTSLGGIPVNMDSIGVDVCYSGTQKCVGAPPGLSPISVSPAAWSVVESRKSGQQDWYFDWRLLKSYYDGSHVYHHTVPVNLYYALNQALQDIQDEGLEARFQRHTLVSEILMRGLSKLGIEPFAYEGFRLPTLNAVRVPTRVTDEAAVRRTLLERYGVEIGGGLGPLKGQIWRIGTMGASATERNVLLLLAALDDILNGA
jgi:alanine-glyoxylate transaminase/serine-glyoxylate transaminase/serine-pyruvate transaminase